MEITVMDYIGVLGVILELHWGYILVFWQTFDY